MDYTESEEWQRFVAHHHEHTVKAMTESAYVMSLVPAAGKVDVKFAVELGLAIMLDKPIIALAQPGVPIPYRLRKVADAVITADLDTEEGRARAARILKIAVKGFENTALQPVPPVEHDGGVHHAVELRGLRVLPVIPGGTGTQHRREPQHLAPLLQVGPAGRGDEPLHLRGQRHVMPVLMVTHASSWCTMLT